MTARLFVQAIIKFVLGIILVGGLIFLPAGTFSFSNGWLFMEILFVPMFFAGLGVRLGWATLPNGVVIGAAVVFLVAYILYAEVLRENTYLSRTIEVQEHQKVIDTGLISCISVYNC